MNKNAIFTAGIALLILCILFSESLTEAQSVAMGIIAGVLMFQGVNR